MAEVRLAIEGKGAVAAAEMLLASPDITGTWQPVGSTKAGSVVSVIVHILLAASGNTLSEQIKDWYQRYQQAQFDKKIDKVVLVANGKRMIVAESSFDEIRQTIMAE